MELVTSVCEFYNGTCINGHLYRKPTSLINRYCLNSPNEKFVYGSLLRRSVEVSMYYYLDIN